MDHPWARRGDHPRDGCRPDRSLDDLCGRLGLLRALRIPCLQVHRWWSTQPHDTARRCAGTDAVGVFKSMDGAPSWQKPSGDLDNTPYVSQLAIDPVTTSTIYATAYDYYGEYVAAVFKSTDGGLNWT